MFFIPGWTPISEVFGQTYRKYQEDWESENLPSEASDGSIGLLKTGINAIRRNEEAKNHATDVLSGVLTEAAHKHKVAALMDDGGTILLSAEIFMGIWPGQAHGAHLCLYTGIIGGDTWPNTHVDKDGDLVERDETEREKRSRFGAYLYKPVVVDRAYIENALAKLGISGPTEPLLGNDEIIASIGEAHNRDPSLTKAHFFENHLSECSMGEANYLWERATSLHPLLAKRGPKPRKR